MIHDKLCVSWHCVICVKHIRSCCCKEHSTILKILGLKKKPVVSFGILVIKHKNAQPSQVSLLQFFLWQYYGDDGVHKISFSLNSWTQWSISLLVQKMLFFHHKSKSGEYSCFYSMTAAVPDISLLSCPWRICDTGGRLWPSLCPITYLCGRTCTSFAELFPWVPFPKILSEILSATVGSLRLLLETAVKMYTR